MGLNPWAVADVIAQLLLCNFNCIIIIVHFVVFAVVVDSGSFFLFLCLYIKSSLIDRADVTGLLTVLADVLYFWRTHTPTALPLFFYTLLTPCAQIGPCAILTGTLCKNARLQALLFVDIRFPLHQCPFFFFFFYN